MKIDEEIWVHGYVDEIRNDKIIVRNQGGYFGTAEKEIITRPPVTYRLEYGNWIPCYIARPLINEEVLCWMWKDCFILNLIEWEGKLAWKDPYDGEIYDLEQVEAWMPLPHPYNPPL